MTHENRIYATLHHCNENWGPLIQTRICGSVSQQVLPSSALKSPDGQHCDDHDHHHGGNVDLPLPRDPDRQHCGEGRHMVGLSGEYAGGGLGLLTIPAALPLLLFLLPQSSSPPPPPAPQPRMLVLPNATLVPALLPSGRSPQPPPSSPPPPPCPSSPCQSLGLVTLLPVFTSLDGGLVRPRGLAHSSSEWGGISAQQQQQQPARNWSTSFGRRAQGTRAARLYPQPTSWCFVRAHRCSFTFQLCTRAGLTSYNRICFLIVGDLHYYSVLLSVVIKRMLPRRSGEVERGLEEGDASSDRDLWGDEEAWCWTLCCWAAVPESRESKSIAGTPATHHSSRPLYSRCPPSQHPNTNTNSETYTITKTKTQTNKNTHIIIHKRDR